VANFSCPLPEAISHLEEARAQQKLRALLVIKKGNFFCSVPVDNMKNLQTDHFIIYITTIPSNPSELIEWDLPCLHTFAERDEAQIRNNFLLQ
jgi:hypothetical protein